MPECTTNNFKGGMNIHQGDSTLQYFNLIFLQNLEIFLVPFRSYYFSYAFFPLLTAFPALSHIELFFGFLKDKTSNF